jgi:hypothetical protein
MVSISGPAQQVPDQGINHQRHVMEAQAEPAALEYGSGLLYLGALAQAIGRALRFRLRMAEIRG